MGSCETYPIHVFSASRPSPLHALAELSETPLLPKELRIQGKSSALSLLDCLPARGLAVVGTRTPLLRTLQKVRQSILGLGQCHFILISGFARGVDREAHEAALEAGIPTIAILGCGLNINYPSRHQLLREKILSQGGLLISEFPDDATPRANYFLQRNRLIAACSSAVWVAQAGKRSGALNTAKWARELNRVCLATPCFPGDPDFAGNQDLIDAHQAHPYWGTHSLGVVWLELAGKLDSSPKRAQSGAQTMEVRSNATLKVSPQETPHKMPEEAPQALEDRRILFLKILNSNRREGATSKARLFNWALENGWSPARFFNALSYIIQVDAVLDKNDLLLIERTASD